MGAKGTIYVTRRKVDRSVVHDLVGRRGFSIRRTAELLGNSYTTIRRIAKEVCVKSKFKPKGGRGKGAPVHPNMKAGKPVNRSALGALSRDKGKVGQREALKIVKYAFPGATNRYTGEEQFNGDPGRDLNGTPGFCFQVQLAKSPTIPQKLSEAAGSCRTVGGVKEIAVALTRKCSKTGSGPWLATLHAHDLMELIFYAKNAPEELHAPPFEDLVK